MVAAGVGCVSSCAVAGESPILDCCGSAFDCALLAACGDLLPIASCFLSVRFDPSEARLGAALMLVAVAPFADRAISCGSHDWASVGEASTLITFAGPGAFDAAAASCNSCLLFPSGCGSKSCCVASGRDFLDGTAFGSVTVGGFAGPAERPSFVGWTCADATTLANRRAEDGGSSLVDWDDAFAGSSAAVVSRLSIGAVLRIDSSACAAEEGLATEVSWHPTSASVPNADLVLLSVAVAAPFPDANA